MHPVITRQLAADHIREIHAKAEDERLARQARRAAWSVRARRGTWQCLHRVLSQSGLIRDRIIRMPATRRS